MAQRNPQWPVPSPAHTHTGTHMHAHTHTHTNAKRAMEDQVQPPLPLPLRGSFRTPVSRAEGRGGPPFYGGWGCEAACDASCTQWAA